jgi:hypothetical protein
LDVPDSATVSIPSGYNLIGVQGHTYDAFVVLPKANSVPAGWILIVSLETPNADAGPYTVTINTQVGDTIPSQPISTPEMLIANAVAYRAIRYYSDGATHWYHW